MSLGPAHFGDLTRFRDCRTVRESSWDRSGGNHDSVAVGPSETRVLARIPGPGMITHIWFTVSCKDPLYPRKMLLRAYWDDEEDPSIDAPLGDFFGIGHAILKSYQSAPLNMTGNARARDRTAFNCYFQMPFRKNARIEVVNEGEVAAHAFYYYIDYEQYSALPKDTLSFHAKWRRENPCDGWIGEEDRFTDEGRARRGEARNLSGDGNYLILQAEGKGHYVGCNLSVHNLCGRWWGEGDDMIFVDGEVWPPSLHGTGSEDYFCNAWGMQNECFLYAGASLFEHEEPGPGKCTSYRFHIQDPVVFHRSIRVTIEHGHANNRSDDYSSVAYWYQTEPHVSYWEMLPVDKRLPRPDEEGYVLRHPQTP
jgi:hypothetical protein